MSAPSWHDVEDADRHATEAAQHAAWVAEHPTLAQVVRERDELRDQVTSLQGRVLAQATDLARTDTLAALLADAREGLARSGSTAKGVIRVREVLTSRHVTEAVDAARRRVRASRPREDRGAAYGRQSALRAEVERLTRENADLQAEREAARTEVEALRQSQVCERVTATTGEHGEIVASGCHESKALRAEHEGFRAEMRLCQAENDALRATVARVRALVDRGLRNDCSCDGCGSCAVEDHSRRLRAALDGDEHSPALRFDPRSARGVIARAADYIGHTPDCEDDDCLACDLRAALDGEGGA